MDGGEDGGAPRLAAAFPCSDSSVAFTPVSESSERPAGAPDVILDRRVFLANGSVLLLVGTGGGEPSNAVARDPLLPGDATSEPSATSFLVSLLVCVGPFATRKLSIGKPDISKVRRRVPFALPVPKLPRSLLASLLNELVPRACRPGETLSVTPSPLRPWN